MRARRLHLVVVVVAACVAHPPVAPAATYEVRACDAASTTDPVNNAWALHASNGHSAEALCPTRGSEFRGITTRITATPVGAGVFERAGFYAPPGTTIAGLHWAGRWKRNGCEWASEIRAQPSQRTLIGRRENANCRLAGDGFDSPQYHPAPPGTTTLLQNTQCGASSCSSGATFHTYHATVVIDDPTPPAVAFTGGGLSTDRWLSGSQQVAYAANDNSGVQRVQASVDGELRAEAGWPCDWTRPAPCTGREASLNLETAFFTDGTHTLRLTATDAAGNNGAAERTFRTDNTPPGRVEPAVVGGESWRRSNGFTIRWKNPGEKHAPIVRARYRLCGPDGECAEGSRSGRNIEELPALPVKALGDSTLRVWLEDEAGNHTSGFASDAIHLRLDPEPPRLAFQAQDPADPLTVVVRAVDAHSGVSGGEIEMRRRGGRTWHSLDTRVEGDRLTATVNDERFKRGSFEFRARAVDHAGNEASTGKRADGGEAAIQLPVRVTTKLRVGFAKVKVKRRVVRRKRGARGRKRGRNRGPKGRRVVKRRVRVYKRRGTLRYRRRTKLRGVLRNPDGQPIDGGSITVLSRPDVDGGDFTTAGIVRTNRRGRFAYAVRGRRSRVLRFRFDGSRRIRGATRDVRVQVPAASTIKADPTRLLNGQATTFTGRVRTRPLPATGKLLEVQAFFRGRYRTISTTRSNAEGRWSFHYRFGATSGTVGYRFRVRLPREGGYPFDTGRSRAVQVVVRGP